VSASWQQRICHGLPWPNRHHQTIDQVSPREVRFPNGQVAVPLCGTQYLALIGQLPPEEWGSLGSNYLGGIPRKRREFEEMIADKCGEDKALAFSNGWAACFSVSELLARLCDLVVSDRYAHNSIIRGLQATKAAVVVRDLNECGRQKIFDEYPNKQIGLVTSAIDGITGSLSEPRWSQQEFGESIWVRDECHTFGTIGGRGLGRIDDLRPDIRVLSLSKAFGSIGAVVTGRGELIEYLSQIASTWIFSTPLPGNIWEINTRIVPILESYSHGRTRILELAERFRRNGPRSGLRVSGALHISGLHLDKSVNISLFEQGMLTDGFYLRVSQSPTRPAGQPCARISFNPWLNESDVDKLIASIQINMNRACAT
jgi:8-amino-7-oxononanoate synthase